MGMSPEQTQVAEYGCTNVACLSPLYKAPCKFDSTDWQVLQVCLNINYKSFFEAKQCDA